MQLLTSVSATVQLGRMGKCRPLSCLFTVALYLCMGFYMKLCKFFFLLTCCLIAKSEVNRRINCTSMPARDLYCSISVLEDLHARIVYFAASALSHLNTMSGKCGQFD